MKVAANQPAGRAAGDIGRRHEKPETRGRMAGLALLVLLPCLGGCVTGRQQAAAPQLTAPDISTQIREVDLSPRYLRRDRSSDTASSDLGARAESYYGDDSAAVAGKPRHNGKQSKSDPTTTGALGDGKSGATAEKGYEVNFENTPIRTVAKAVLGDILTIGYSIDPRVQGTLSLSSGRAIPKRDLLFAFESALRTSSVALIRDGEGYRLIPAPDAVGGGSIDPGEGPQAGYGISVVPLQFVSAQTITKLLENFSTKPGMVRADPSRNLLVIQGSGADRRAAIETALSFDADWMRGQSVGIYPVTNSTLDPIISELERIIDSGEGGLSQNVVKLQPITRMNAVLVVARKPALLKTVSNWISRLDKSGSAGAGVRVYRMRYGDARQTAALLNDIFLGNSAGGLDSPTNQLVPGSAAVASSSGRSGLSGTQQSPSSLSNASPPSSGSSSFDTRFADASGGRNAQNGAGGLTGSNARSGILSTGATPVGPGPILPNVRISADAVNNALLIYANQENYRVIERTLNQLDRPQLQVAIDATIAEISLNDQLSYGVQFFLNSKSLGMGPDNGSVLNTAKDAIINRVLPGFNFLVGTEAQPKLILDALHQVTDVKILSTPSVVVVDNQTASLQVGDQIPITTRTAQSVDVPTAPVVNSIDYRNTGVILRVAPRINANGNVLLDIEQEISSVSDTDTANTLTPTVSQRKVRSTIAVASGQTVLLGGLISERQDRGRSGVPGLEQIPGLGDIFAQKSGKVQRTELVIFIKPQIIRNGVDAARIASELRAKMQGIFLQNESQRPAPQVVRSKN